MLSCLSGDPKCPKHNSPLLSPSQFFFSFFLLSRLSSRVRYDTNLLEGTGLRETSPTLAIHDVELVLLRFADLQSFSEDTGGGGRESNLRLIPYQIHAILYVHTTYVLLSLPVSYLHLFLSFFLSLRRSRQVEREEKFLQNFLARPELTNNEPFDVDGPFFLTTLAMILMKPIDWDKHRIMCLQKLLLTAHLRSIPSPADRTKSVPFFYE